MNITNLLLNEEEKGSNIEYPRKNYAKLGKCLLATLAINLPSTEQQLRRALIKLNMIYSGA